MEEQVQSQTARDVKRTLADGLGVSRFLDLLIMMCLYTFLLSFPMRKKTRIVGNRFREYVTLCQYVTVILFKGL